MSSALVRTIVRVYLYLGRERAPRTGHLSSPLRRENIPCRVETNAQGEAMSDTQGQTVEGRSVMPSLTVNNVKQSLGFFEGLGFEIEDRWEVDGVVQGAMLKAGQARLGLSQDDGKKGLDRIKGTGMRLYIEVADDIDQLAARARAAGITLGSEPHDTEWGSRAFDVTEPSGFALTITSPPTAK
jgi:uncharacterized glyoxalase superfamily protein PhnB